MNIVQAKHLKDYTEIIYTYKLPREFRVDKGNLLLVENKANQTTDIAVAVTDSEDVNENVLNMIMKGQTVCSKVLAIYLKFPIGGLYE